MTTTTTDDRTLLTASTWVDGVHVTFEFKRRTPPRMYYPERGRPYMSSTEKDYRKKPRLYVSTEGESLLENLANRTTRPSRTWGKLVRRAVAQLELAGKLGWSQHAGCGACPCSPGFIWDGAPAVEGVHTYDVWVRLQDVSIVRDDAEALAVQANRVAQLVADPTLPFARPDAN